jgi:hypothetical protein
MPGYEFTITGGFFCDLRCFAHKLQKNCLVTVQFASDVVLWLSDDSDFPHPNPSPNIWGRGYCSLGDSGALHPLNQTG